MINRMSSVGFGIFVSLFFCTDALASGARACRLVGYGQVIKRGDKEFVQCRCYAKGGGFKNHQIQCQDSGRYGKTMFPKPKHLNAQQVCLQRCGSTNHQACHEAIGQCNRNMVKEYARQNGVSEEGFQKIYDDMMRQAAEESKQREDHLNRIIRSRASGS